MTTIFLSYLIFFCRECCWIRSEFSRILGQMSWISNAWTITLVEQVGGILQGLYCRHHFVIWSWQQERFLYSQQNHLRLTKILSFFETVVFLKELAMFSMHYGRCKIRLIAKLQGSLSWTLRDLRWATASSVSKNTVYSKPRFDISLYTDAYHSRVLPGIVCKAICFGKKKSKDPVRKTQVEYSRNCIWTHFCRCEGGRPRQCGALHRLGACGSLLWVFLW